MPSFQTVAERCNAVFASERIAALQGQIALFLGRETLGAIAVRLQLASEEQGRYLDSMPQAMAAALKALVAENLRRDRPFGMQFLWFEGAEWEFLISEVLPTDRPESRGGISLMLRSPKL